MKISFDLKFSMKSRFKMIVARNSNFQFLLCQDIILIHFYYVMR